jgi:hypothetical protein
MKIRNEGFVLMLNRSVYLLPSSSVHDIFGVSMKLFPCKALF